MFVGMCLFFSIPKMEDQMYSLPYFKAQKIMKIGAIACNWIDQRNIVAVQSHSQTAEQSRFAPFLPWLLLLLLFSLCMSASSRITGSVFTCLTMQHRVQAKHESINSFALHAYIPN